MRPERQSLGLVRPRHAVVVGTAKGWLVITFIPSFLIMLR